MNDEDKKHAINAVNAVNELEKTSADIKQLNIVQFELGYLIGRLETLSRANQFIRSTMARVSHVDVVSGDPDKPA